MKRLAIFAFLILTVTVIGLIGCSGDGSSTNPVAPTINPPSGLDGVPQSDSSIKLTWVNGSNDAGVLIQRGSGAAGDFTTLTELAAGTTTYTDNGLNEGSEYRYRLFAKRGDQQSDPTTAISRHTFPKAPADMAVTQVSETGCSLVWQDLSAAEDAYELQRSPGDVNHFQPLAMLNADAVGYDDTGLTPNQTYYYRIRAKLGVLSSGWSNTANVTTFAAPSNPVAQALSDSEIKLTWQDNSGNETSFKLERSVGDDQNWTELATVNADVVSYNDTGLAEGTTYYYRVKLYTALGESEPTSAASAVTWPHTPANLTATSSEDRLEVAIAWEDLSGVETAYELQRHTGEFGQFAVIATLNPDVAAYLDEDVSTATTYYYRVRATFNAIPSLWSNTASATTSILTPDAPTDLTGQGLSASEVAIAWTDNSSNEDGFVVERSLIAIGGWRAVDTVSADQVGFNDAGLNTLTNYYYRVYAYNEYGKSGYSNVIQVTTLEPPPNAPSSLTATALSPALVQLHWNDASNNETGFILERSLDQNQGWSELTRLGANTTQYNDFSVSQMTTYYYRAYSYNDVGRSSASNVATATTPQAPPNAPGNLDASAPNYFTVDLTWQDNSSDETGFNLEKYNSQRRVWEVLDSLESNVTNYTDLDVQARTLYQYRVKCYNGGGASGYSNTAEVTTPDSPPDAPDSLMVERGEGFGHLVISWLPGSYNEDLFVIERFGPGDDDFQIIGDTVGTVYGYDDVGLDNETWYTYRVKALNEIGESAYSDTAGALTPSLVLLDEDFEEYDVGTTPDENNWATYSQGGTSWARVSDAEAHHGEKSLDFHDPDEGNNWVWLYNQHGAVDQGFTEMWLKLTENGWFGPFGAAGGSYAWQIQFMADGGIRARDNLTMDTLNATWPAGQWFKLRVEFVSADQIYDIFLDDQLIADDLGLPTAGPITWTHLLVYSDVTMQDAWVDQVHVEVVLPGRLLRGPERPPVNAPRFDRLIAPSALLPAR